MKQDMIKNALDANLSGLRVSQREQAQMLAGIVGEKRAAKRKMSSALVFAVCLTLVLGGAALAAGLGLFGQLGMGEDNLTNGERLQRLDEVASSYGTTRRATVPDLSHMGDTDVGRAYAAMSGWTFDVTIDQAYCDGSKLYYAYTLHADKPMEPILAEGMPTGMEKWTYTSDQNPSRNDETIAAWLDSHADSGYAIRYGFGLGDGADLPDGTSMMIWDSGADYADAQTIRGFQEVEIPENVTVGEELTFTLEVRYFVKVMKKTAGGYAWDYVWDPELRGHVPVTFTAKVNSDTVTRTGSVTGEDYTATASVRISDVDVNGEVYFDAPTWVAAWDEECETGVFPDGVNLITDYQLIAGDEVLRNVGGGYGVSAWDALHRYSVSVRFDLPKNCESLILRPVDSRGAVAGEDIVLR